jgi:hypothetical protein
VVQSLPPNPRIDVRTLDSGAEFVARRRHPLWTLAAVLPAILAGLPLMVVGPAVTILLLRANLEVPELDGSAMVWLLLLAADVVLLLFGLALIMRGLTLLFGAESARVAAGALRWELRWRGELWKDRRYGLEEVEDLVAGDGLLGHGVVVVQSHGSKLLGFQTLSTNDTRWLAAALKQAAKLDPTAS